MTSSGTAVSDRLADHLRDLRGKLSMSREELATAAQEHGAGETFTAKVVGLLESGRRDPDGRRTRLFTLDEIFALAAALEVTPLELLGADSASLFLGDDTALEVVCPSCAADPGQLEQVVREDLAQLDELSAFEATLVETAYKLARTIDAAQGEAIRLLPALTKELRATVEQLAAGRRRSQDDDEDEFDDLDEPE